MTVAVASPVRYLKTIGRLSQKGPGYNTPVGVATAPGGRLYIVSRSNIAQAAWGYLRVSINSFDEDFLGEFCTFGRGDGQLTWPTAVAVDQDVNVYVSDEARQDVQMFDKDGNFVRRWGSEGSGPGEFNHPTGLAVDHDGHILVSDSLNNRIQKFNHHGEFISSFGEAGTGPGQFNMPWGLTVDSQNRLYVVDWRNSRVQQFSADGSYLASFGNQGGEGQLDRPACAAVDSVGNVYVTDFGPNLVKIYAPDGTHLKTLAGDATLSKQAATYIAADPEMIMLREQHADEIAEWERVFNCPIGIAVDEDDHILIADSGRHRLQVYERV